MCVVVEGFVHVSASACRGQRQRLWLSLEQELQAL